MSRDERELRNGWTLTAVTGPVPAHLEGLEVNASVPGVVHTDLLDAGLIPDPYLDDHEKTLAWIGRTDWRYATNFDWDSAGHGRRYELVFHGLDTIATVHLNGTVIAHTRNQHRSHRVDVTDVLVGGQNELAVTFAAALPHAEELHAERPRPHANLHPYNAIRKMACNFGWDWGPDLVTAGIWRPITIESWDTARIASVRPLVTEASTDRGTVSFEVTLAREVGAAEPLSLTAQVGQATTRVDVPEGALSVTMTMDVDRPLLWWPRGYGDQPLYAATVELSGPSASHTGEPGDPLDSWRGRLGFRTVEVDTENDGAGSPFRVKVNGMDVFIRGANWIPDDAFPSRVDRNRYARRITDATEAGVNLLRVWGGGIYESRHFYELCDERGVLVWQDFLFACAAYAEEALREEVEAEAREAVTRLSAHASLLLWNGNNENLWGYHDWGWKQELGQQSWGSGFYDQLLPDIVRELDPTRPYIPGSPFSPDPDDHPNDPSTGLTHIWDVWNEKDYRVYGEYTPRFVSEFGFQGPPNWSTLTTSVHDDPLTPSSDVMLVHQKAEDGNAKLERGWSGHFPTPESLDDWHWTTQLNQARAVEFGVRRFRSLAPYCRGAIVWQLNDCWPVVSWALVDGYGRRKPVWYALRRAFADRVVSVQERDGSVAVVVTNDAPRPWRGTLAVRRVAFDGGVLAEQSCEVSLDARGNGTYEIEPSVAEPRHAGRELLVAEVVGEDPSVRQLHFFAEDVGLELPAPAVTGELHAVPGGYELEITARTLIRDLALQIDRLDPDAEVDDQLVDLLPGERTLLMITTGTTLSEQELLAPPVLRTANDLVAQPTHP